MSSQFPAVWLELLIRYSDLGHNTATLIDELETKVRACEKRGIQVFPLHEARYRALELVAPEDCRALCMGQDPYHGLVTLPDGRLLPEATGLSFSVPGGAKLPPSLRNIFKELAEDLAIAAPVHGDLSAWANQGVCLLNTVLTVEKDKAKSHAHFGWQILTSAIIQALSRSRSGIVFILWGNLAKGIEPCIADNGHCIIRSSHPSPLFGACFKGFFGSRPFSRTNQALLAQGYPAIDWSLPGN